MERIEELDAKVVAVLRECASKLPTEASEMSKRLESYARSIEESNDGETLENTLYEISHWKNLPDSFVSGLSSDEWGPRADVVRKHAYRAFRARKTPIWWRRLFW
jgi:hypothetical protein